jgi:hypothetical protein
VESYSHEQLPRSTPNWSAIQQWSFVCLNQHKEGTMSLSKQYVRDGNRKIIASVTTGFDDTSAVVRDEKNEIAGRTSERFQTARDAHGNLVATNSSDPGLLIGRTK